MSEKTKNDDAAEQELSKVRSQLHWLAKAASFGVWDWDLLTDSITYSPEWKEQLGCSAEEISSTRSEFENRLHPDDRNEVLSIIHANLRGKDSDYEVEFRMEHKDGNYRWIRSCAQIVRDNNGRAVRVFGFNSDITEKRRLEDQVRHSQKMESVGQLASGVAHDFNNILTAMRIQAELASTYSGLPEDVQEFLSDILASTDRAADLTRQLLAFGRRQVMQPHYIDLNEIVTRVVKMLQRLLGEQVRIQINLHPSPLVTYADAGMMDQVLMNLAVNARDAMPKGGRLIIETTERVLGENDIQMYSNISPGRYVGLRVSDTGCGIPPESLSHIFEAFYTTKEPGKGTGLGLATVDGIVSQHRGSLKVYSEVEKGTTFQILLPASGADGEATGEGLTRHETIGGTETILLVEDDEEVRDLTAMLLAQHGYKVLSANDGPEALRLLESNSEPLHLLLTDMVMPYMQGRELALECQRRNPQLKILFTSGYSPDLADPELNLKEGGNFLQKPWTIHQLLETIRQILDNR